MTTDQKNKLLKTLATSSEGKALGERLQELIDNLTDARNYPTEDFEIEGKTSIKAASVLEKIGRDLKVLAKKKQENNVQQYN